MANEGYIGIPYKKYRNPGGDGYWVWGRSKIYDIYIYIGVPKYDLNAAGLVSSKKRGRIHI